MDFSSIVYGDVKSGLANVLSSLAKILQHYIVGEINFGSFRIGTCFLSIVKTARKFWYFVFCLTKF